MTKLLFGACEGMDVNLFGGGEDGAIAPEALAACASCPIRQECLERALEEEAGKQMHVRSLLRGGLTPRARYLISAGVCADCGKECGDRDVLCGACRKARHQRMAANKGKSIPQYERTCIACGAVSPYVRTDADGFCGICGRRDGGADGYYGKRAAIRVA